MARPIEATPVLRGRQAARFIKNMQESKPLAMPVLNFEQMHRHVADMLKKGKDEQK